MATLRDKNTRILTHQGNVVDFADYQMLDVNLDSICNNLANVCRFGGAVNYSVLTHTLCGTRVCEILGFSEEIQKSYFLHDFAEGVTGVDMPTPLKNMFPDYAEFEHGIQDTIYKNFNSYEHVEAKNVDVSMMFLEKELLLPQYSRLELGDPPFVLTGREFNAIRGDIQSSGIPLRSQEQEFFNYCKKFNMLGA